MIPKVIHYCWFGGNDKNDLMKSCIASWKKYCPDYEIIEWNESNYDVSKHPFMKKAYDAKKWAFVSDYARIDIIYQYGGVYLDTDVELIASLDQFLKYDFYAGFENETFVNFGLGFGSIKDNCILHDILDHYDTVDFPDNNFDLSSIACPKIQTEVLKKYGLSCNNKNQSIKGGHIFSSEYFCPISFKTGAVRITDKTVSIHHFNMAWLDKHYRKSKAMEWKLIKILGLKWGKLIASMINFPGKLISHIKDGTFSKYIRFLMRRK